jgi:PadR family transcriptional regulator AphA
MSLDYAILGFLNYRPFTGYDLKKALDTSVRHFWPADQTQIYRTLISLTEKGLAEMEVVDQSNRPDRKVYRITGVGREALRVWLTEPHRSAENRNSLLVQVFFAGQLSDEEVLPIFERLSEQFRSLLAVYDVISQENDKYQEYTASPRELYFWMLTLEAGKVTARANLELVESILRRIRNKELPQR